MFKIVLSYMCIFWPNGNNHSRRFFGITVHIAGTLSNVLLVKHLLSNWIFLIIMLGFSY